MQDNKRISIIGNSSETLVRFRLSLIQKLSVHHTVIAVSPEFSLENREILQAAGAELVTLSASRFGVNPVRETFAIFEMVRFYIDYKIDISFSYFIKPVIYSSIASFLAGVGRRVSLIEGLGYVFTTNKDAEFKFKLLKSIISNLMKLSLPLASKIVFLNKDDAAEVQGFVSLWHKSEILGGIGIDLEYFKPQARNHNPKIVFLLIGRILKEKGILEFIEAARKMNHSEMEFWIAGGLDTNPGGIDQQHLLQVLQGSGVKWLGSVSDVRECLKNCDVFVLPSYREGLPRSTQEAMGMGKAIITTDVEGCRDTVIPFENGLLVQSRSVDELCEAFAYYQKNPDSIEVFGRSSRELAEKWYSGQVQDMKLINLILGL